MSKIKALQKLLINNTRIDDIQTIFYSEKFCIEFLEKIRWNNLPQSPFSNNSIVYKCNNGKYRCKKTQKYFTVKSNTIFDGTKIQMQYWFFGIIIFIQNEEDIVRTRKSITLDLKITGRTVWLMLNKIRFALNHAIFKNNFNLLQKKCKKITFEQLLYCIMSVPRKKSVFKK